MKSIFGELLNAIGEELGSEGLTKEEISEIKNWIDWKVGFEKVILHPEYQDGEGRIKYATLFGFQVFSKVPIKN